MSSVSSSAGSSSGPGSGAGAARAASVMLSSVGPGLGLVLGLLAVAFVGLFWQWMARQYGPSGFSWNHTEDWGHAYLVPLVSGFYLWSRRAELSRVPTAVFWPGMGLILMGIASYVYFMTSFSNHMFQGAAMIATLAGLVLLLTGPAMLRATGFPIAYLSFAVAISEMVMNKLTWQLKIWASVGAEWVLNLAGLIVGFDVDRTGNVLIVSDGVKQHPLNVAEACAGMRMVIAFVALAAAVAFFSCRQWWQRVAVLLLSVPVALGMNVMRVAVLGLLTLEDPDLATGGAHTFIGTLLLIPAFALFMASVWALKAMVPDAAPEGASS